MNAFQPRSTNIALPCMALQPPLYSVEELERGPAVEDAVVEGDFEVHDAADGDGVVDHHRALDDGLSLQEGRLRMIDDRGRGDAT